MRALVTGSTGFIGANLTDLLGDLGHEVVGVDRRPRADAWYRQIIGDLNEPTFGPELRSMLGWADVVFHLAARPGIRSTRQDIERLRRLDIVSATGRLLSMTPPDTHLIVASSSAVYGGARRTTDGLRPSTEADLLEPKGGYARAKAEMELLCRRWSERGGKLAIVRPFTVIGEGQRDDMAIARWLDAVEAGEPVTVLGSLERSRDVTDVRKVVAGLVRLAEIGHRGVVNLGAGRPRTLGEMIEAVFSAVGRRAPVITRPAGDEEVEHTFADTGVASSLGIDLDTELFETVERQCSHRGSDRQIEVLTA